MERSLFFELKLNTCDINPYYAHALLNKHFCNRLHRRGLCINCRSCTDYVRAAFTFYGKPKSPVGLLIWRLKDQMSKFVDDNHIPISETEYGDNAFQSLLEDLDER